MRLRINSNEYIFQFFPPDLAQKNAIQLQDEVTNLTKGIEFLKKQENKTLRMINIITTKQPPMLQKEIRNLTDEVGKLERQELMDRKKPPPIARIPPRFQLELENIAKV